MIRTVTLNGRMLEYELLRKQVKNINLRVKPSGKILLSASPRVPLQVIEAFLQEHAARILRAVEACEQRARNTPAPAEYVDGETVTVFGEPFCLRLAKGTKNTASIEGGILTLTVREPANKELRQRTLQRFLDEHCRERLTTLCRYYYPRFAVSGIDLPIIRFRRMTSRWGSCQCTRAIITFNLSLIELPLAFAEYVVVHELAHLWHPNHSKSFYACVAKELPDWKVRRLLARTQRP